MRRPTYTWRVIRGETIRSYLRLTNENGTPVDLTGSSLTVRPASGPLAASIANAAQGRILIEVRGLAVGQTPYEMAITWADTSQLDYIRLNFAL